MNSEPILEKQGLSPQEIALPIGGKDFILEDSGERVVMRKPLITDLLAAQQDSTIESPTEELLSILSQVCTFNGKPRNWKDFGQMSLMDYNELTVEYLDLTRTKKTR